MRADDWFWLLVFLGCTFAVAVAASAFTSSSVSTWYPQLRKPSFNPPAWIFAPVWTALYLMMGLSAWIIWRNAGWAQGGTALTLFFTQLSLNGLWSALFFRLRRPGLALLEIIVLTAAVVFTAVAFFPISNLAFWLVVPYLGWLAFASLLNFEIWRLNREAQAVRALRKA